MDYLNINIASNLRRLRQAKGWSLDTVAEQTGVSKSLLGKIERGEGNPAIGTLGRIASGLRVELGELIRNPEDSVCPVRREHLIPTKEIPGEYRVFNFFPYERDRSFEIYVIEIFSGSCYQSGAHGENTREYIVVNQGELNLKLGKETFHVKQGDALRFDTDKEHTYCNKGDQMLELVCVFSYR